MADAKDKGEGASGSEPQGGRAEKAEKPAKAAKGGAGKEAKEAAAGCPEEVTTKDRESPRERGNRPLSGVQEDQ